MKVFEKNLFAERHFPESISPEQLDEYLANGWYRMGQSIFTTHFLTYDFRIFSTIWLRSPLEDFTFSKTNRKLLRRNEKLFQVRVEPMSLDKTKDFLYQKYARTFKGMIAPSLRDALMDGSYSNIYSTLEVQIFDGNTLVACSFFDEGKDSLTSIMGIYDPDYAKHSLGFYTMLEEIKYGIHTGRKFYYPGYFVPGNSRFDYKLRIGNTEYFDLRDQSWLPFEHFSKEKIPVILMRKRLESLAGALKEAGIQSRICSYPLYEARMVELFPLPYLEFPIFLEVPLAKASGIYHLVVYNFIHNTFVLMRCSNISAFPSRFNPRWLDHFTSSVFFRELLLVEDVLFSNGSEEAFVEWIKKAVERGNIL